MVETSSHKSENDAAIMIADAHDMVRESITIRMEQERNVRVVASTSDGYSTLKLFRQHKPEVLILDLSLPQPGGRDTLRKVLEFKPDVKVIVTTSEASISTAYYALSRGAMAFLPKQVASAEFVNAVNAVLGGFSYLPRDLMSQFVASRRNVSRVGNVFGLSPREMEIVSAIAEGQTTKVVAAELGISVRTVETHRHNIYKKTNCKDQKELANIADII